MFPIDVTRDKRTGYSVIENGKGYIASFLNFGACIFIFMYAPFLKWIISIFIFIFIEIIIIRFLIVKETKTKEEYERFDSNILIFVWSIASTNFSGNNIFETIEGDTFIMLCIKHDSMTDIKRLQAERTYKDLYNEILIQNLDVQNIVIDEDYHTNKVFDIMNNLVSKTKDTAFASLILSILDHIKTISKYEGTVPCEYIKVIAHGSINRHKLNSIIEYIDNINRIGETGFRSINYCDKSEMFSFLQKYLNLEVLDINNIYNKIADMRGNIVKLCGFDCEEENPIPIDIKYKKEDKIIEEQNKYFNLESTINVSTNQKLK